MAVKTFSVTTEDGKGSFTTEYLDFERGETNSVSTTDSDGNTVTKVTYADKEECDAHRCSGTWGPSQGTAEDAPL